MDYMGSAEFEFGALPNSLRRMRVNREKLALRKVNVDDSPSLSSDNRQGFLRTYSYLAPDEFQTYEGFLMKLRRGSLHTKERTQFSIEEQTRIKQRSEKYTYSPTIADFWWDIENDVMFFFRKEFSSRLPVFLNNSFKKLFEQTPQ